MIADGPAKCSCRRVGLLATAELSELVLLHPRAAANNLMSKKIDVAFQLPIPFTDILAEAVSAQNAMIVVHDLTPHQ
eukprot:9918471-Heterocapsa_arctica.AAC.1